MAGLDDEFNFVVASVNRAVRQQQRACDVVLRDKSASSHGLAKHLSLAYAAIENRVENREKQYQNALDDAMRHDAIVEMREMLWKVRELQSNLEWLAAAHKSPLDLGTRYFVEDIARAIVAPRVELTIVSGLNASYATSYNPWEPLIKGWGAGIPSGEPIVVVVFLPRREEASGLLHPLIAHELGHAADERHQLVNSIWKKAKNRARLSKRFAEAVHEFSSSEEVDTETARNHIAERLRSWIAEALCDSIAIHHLGPSYLYAFMAEVVAGNMNQPGSKHPSPRQRICHQMDDLDRLGWKPTMNAADKHLLRWIAGQCEQIPTFPGLESFLAWAVDDLHAVIRQTTQGLLGSRVFRPNAGELKEVAELLEAGIPPAQRRSRVPVARETILLACWHAGLRANGGGTPALPAAPDTPELVDLLPTALELSGLAHAWEPAP